MFVDSVLIETLIVDLKLLVQKQEIDQKLAWSLNSAFSLLKHMKVLCNFCRNKMSRSSLDTAKESVAFIKTFANLTPTKSDVVNQLDFVLTIFDELYEKGFRCKPDDLGIGNLYGIRGFIWGEKSDSMPYVSVSSEFRRILFLFDLLSFF